MTLLQLVSARESDAAASYMPLFRGSPSEVLLKMVCRQASSHSQDGDVPCTPI